MKKKWRIGLLTVGMLVMLSGCTQEAEQSGTDADVSASESAAVQETASEEPEQEETVSGEAQATASEEAEETEAEETTVAEESADGQEAALVASASEIVLENGQQDENTAALVYYEFQKEFTNQDGKTIGEVTYTIPQLTARSTEAGMINQDILAWYEDSLANADEMSDIAAEEEYETDSDRLLYTSGAEYSLTYLDDTKICLLLDGYEYTGGAHGMPSKTALIYDLTSGQRLEAEDLFDVTEEEFETLFTEAFCELIESDSDEYWEDAMDYVGGAADFTNENYYLTETGVTFYFEPYELAAYARGYVEAEISYDKLPLK